MKALMFLFCLGASQEIALLFFQSVLKLQSSKRGICLARMVNLSFLLIYVIAGAVYYNINIPWYGYAIGGGLIAFIGYEVYYIGSRVFWQDRVQNELIKIRSQES